MDVLVGYVLQASQIYKKIKLKKVLQGLFNGYVRLGCVLFLNKLAIKLRHCLVGGWEAKT